MMPCFAGATSQAVGGEATLLRRKEAEIRRDYIDAPQTGAPFRRALANLAAAAGEASSPNWDGYGAHPVNIESMQQSLRLLTHISPDLPTPEIGVDPDGEVSLEWYREPRQLFSVSVSATGTLSYAGMFGKNSVYGNEAFADDYLPVAIRANLRRLFGFDRFA